MSTSSGRHVLWWSLGGAVFGSVFVVAAVLILFGSDNDGSAVGGLMSIVATAPVILGCAAAVIGKQHLKILANQAETERLVIERTEQLSGANLKLAELLRAKDQFVSVVSHELRNALTTVVGFASQMQETLPPADREIAELIELEGQAAANIIEDLLVDARIDIGEVAVHPEAVELADLVGKCVDVFARQCQDSQIMASLDTARSWADPVRVRQIVRNLLTNASRYGGPSVRVETSTAEGLASLAVIDNGDGVAEEVVGTLFEPYGHDAASQAENSVGLGLHVSRTLARLMGGDLLYERRNGETCFRLVLPPPAGDVAGQIAGASAAR